MKNNIINLVRRDILAMSAYRSARSEALQGSIFLDANENAFFDKRYSRYIKQQPTDLTQLLSKIYGVCGDEILVTRGSDEGIDLLIRLFCQAGLDKIMICPPTYGMYKVAAAIQGAETIEIPLIKAEGFALDVKAVLRASQPSVKLIFLCSPNNPTSNILSKTDILFLCQSLEEKSVIVIDEAYIEFSENESLVSYINEFPNLVILRTLSKAYGLAGVRCGVTIANTTIISLLMKIIAPYPIPAPVAKIVCRKLNAKKSINIIEIIKHEKEKLVQFLENMPFVKKVWKSQTNYILIEVTSADLIMNLCLRHGIVLRNRSNEYGLNNCIRITIGTPCENALLCEVLSHA